LEAVIQLQAEGFLVSLPRRGTLVRTVDFESLRGLFLVREALECQAARIYCGDILRDATHLDELAAVADAGEEKSITELWRAESAFHSSLVAATKFKPLIGAHTKAMQRKLFASIHLLLAGEAFAGGNHVLLLRGLRKDDPDQAEKRIRRHLRFNKERLGLPGG
jgi:DNA-binding GntR family transcriptional regulator